MSKKPNLVLVVVDQMRGDCMGIAGHPEVKTPYLDSLAHKGVYFPRAYSACPSCIPARAALYTGMSQSRNGRVGYQDLVRWDYEHTIAGELSKAGYYTHCVGKMHVHPLRSTLGFHNIRLHDGYILENRIGTNPVQLDQRRADDYYWWLKDHLGISADPNDTGLECNSWITRPWIYDERYHPTNWVATECLDFLRRRDPDKPFFLMASFVRPHPPLDAPAYYLDMYNRQELKGPLEGDWDDKLQRFGNDYMFLNKYAPTDPQYLHEMRAGYYAAITHMDHQLGRLIAGLQEERLMEETVFIFVSDHGDMLGDHQRFRKCLPYEGSAHIPMFISGPESYIGKQGRVCSDLVELRDVMPTLLELAGAPIPECVDGRSMLHPMQREYLHGEHCLGMESNHYIVTETDKYIWYSQTGTELYFNLEADPGESHNAAAENPERVAQMRQWLIQELDGREEGYSDGTQLFVGKSPVNTLNHPRKN